MTTTHRSDATMTVAWDPPPPRPGPRGLWDRFAGPGATRAENRLQVIGVALLGGLTMALVVRERGEDVAAWQIAVAAILAVDIAGGIVTNATSAAKRWYHRPAEGLRSHLGFVALHATQIGIVAAIFTDEPVAYFAATYGLLLATSYVVLSVPLYLQRSIALLLAAAAVPVSELVAADVVDAGMAWFTPLLFLKILVSHLTTEVPFRPVDVRD